MKQPEDRYTLELPQLRGGMPEALKPPMRSWQDPSYRRPPGRGRKPGESIGAYAGRIHIDNARQLARIRAKRTQAEIAALAGVSERTIRNWEQGATKTSPEALRAILAALARCGAAVETGKPAPGRRPVKYRSQWTGETWSGRGQKPVWLRAALNNGHQLAEFLLP